jgi:hypothetical protein
VVEPPSISVGLLWRAEWDPLPADAVVVERCRLHSMFAAFSALGVRAEPVVYADDAAEVVRGQLLRLDGVLVWVNPIEQGLDRSRLDPLLREVAEAGVFVSAHPDVIQKIGTKQVLADSARMSWSTETHLYTSHDQLVAELPGRLAGRGPLVLKQYWGMGGTGVWKVELKTTTGPSDERRFVHVQHAEKGSVPEDVRLGVFLERCRPYFDTGPMVEQPFQPRLAEGMIRVYLSHDRVVGFAHQYPAGLLPPKQAATLPTAKVFLPSTEADYQRLRTKVESDWIPALRQLQQVTRSNLPVIWDVDFLLGPKDPADQDTYVLCEINASSTFTFPGRAMPIVAQAAIEQVEERTARTSG